jgi:hypothetical protein
MQSNHPDCIEKPADAHLDLVIFASPIRCTAALATHCMITPLRRLDVPTPREPLSARIPDVEPILQVKCSEPSRNKSI